jgi:hypothetical protein
MYIIFEKAVTRQKGEENLQQYYDQWKELCDRVGEKEATK